MKTLFYGFFLCLVLFGNAFAINLGGILKEVEKGSSKSISKSLDKKVDKVINKVEKKIDQKVAKYEKKIAEVEESFDKIKNLRDKAEYYLKIAKIVIAALSSGALVLIFTMWRIWKNVVGMRKVVENVANYKDIEKRLQALEKKVS